MDGLSVGTSRTLMNCQWTLGEHGWVMIKLAQRGRVICRFQHSMAQLSGGAIEEHG